MINRLQQSERFFKGTQYQALVDGAWSSYQLGDLITAESLLAKLPTPDQLLTKLIEKLKGNTYDPVRRKVRDRKPVYDTLKRIAEGKVESNEEHLKGLFSLGTHTLIEIEQGAKEYRALLPYIYEKIGSLLPII